MLNDVVLPLETIAQSLRQPGKTRPFVSPAPRHPITRAFLLVNFIELRTTSSSDAIPYVHLGSGRSSTRCLQKQLSLGVTPILCNHWPHCTFGFDLTHAPSSLVTSTAILSRARSGAGSGERTSYGPRDGCGILRRPGQSGRWADARCTWDTSHAPWTKRWWPRFSTTLDVSWKCAWVAIQPTIRGSLSWSLEAKKRCVNACERCGDDLRPRVEKGKKAI